MAETVLERHYRERMQSVRQIAQQELEQTVHSWRDVDDLTSLCTELSQVGRQLFEKEYNRIFKEPNLTVAWLQERRQVIEDLSQSFLELAASIKDSASHLPRTDGAPSEKEVFGRLESAIQTFTEAKRSVLDRWPIGSPEELAEARTASREDALDAEEAFAQIAGVDVETWRRRVEEYKQSRQK